VRDLALDTIGDIALTTVGSVRAASMVTGPDALRQKLRLRLSLGAGEYVLDRTVGMPLFSQIFNRASGRAVAESVYRRAIATCPGVRSLDSLRLTVDTQRRAQLTFTVTAETGEVLTVADFVAAS
jgi:hypothetical protein